MPIVFDSLSMAQYLKDNLQQIFRILLDFKPLALLPAPALALQQYKGPCERPLKDQFLDVYQGKTHLEFSNFFQQYEEYFAIAGAKSKSWVLFVAIFFKDTPLFCWQQYQRKVEDEANISIIWEKFKAFLCQSLGECKVFVDTIWSTIKKYSQH